MSLPGDHGHYHRHDVTAIRLAFRQYANIVARHMRSTDGQAVYDAKMKKTHGAMVDAAGHDAFSAVAAYYRHIARMPSRYVTARHMNGTWHHMLRQHHNTTGMLDGEW